MSRYKAYPAYKDSGVEWVGEIPQSWQVTPLCSVASTGVERNDDGAESNVLSLSYGRIVRRDVEDNHGLLPESFNTYQIVDSGDVILRLTDLQNDKRSLRVGMVNEKGIITSAYLKITAKARFLDRYLYRLLHSYDTIKVFYGMGGGLRQSMKFEEMRRLEILFPSLDEQKKIAAFLDHETAKIDALIEKQQRLIELLKEKRQAVISHAVTKGLAPNAPMKDSGVEWLGEVPAHWDIRRVKFVSGFTTSGPRGWSELVGDEGALFVQSGDLDDALAISFDNAKRVQVGNNAEAQRTLLCDGDVLVCITGAKTGNVAVCSVVPESSYVNQHLCLIRPTSKIEPVFLAVLLKSCVGQTYFELSQYGLKQGLSLEDVREAPVLLPPLAEQAAIVAHITAEAEKFDVLCAQALRSKELLQERRTALISAAVTGKIDVRDWQPAAEQDRDMTCCFNLS